MTRKPDGPERDKASATIPTAPQAPKDKPNFPLASMTGLRLALLLLCGVVGALSLLPAVDAREFPGLEVWQHGWFQWGVPVALEVAIVVLVIRRWASKDEWLWTTLLAFATLLLPLGILHVGQHHAFSSTPMMLLSATTLPMFVIVQSFMRLFPLKDAAERKKWLAGRGLVLLGVAYALGFLLFTVMRALAEVGDDPAPNWIARISGAFLGPLIVGALVTLQAWESAKRPVRPAFEPYALEAGWLNLRREKWDLPRRHDGQSPKNLIGLALSGGGIRSATICLGVLRALAKRQKLRHVDYMSTVSGGGWAGGAITAHAAADRTFNLEDEGQARVLVESMRKAGDYLIPGGLSVSPNVLKPVVVVVVGAILNALAWVSAAATGILVGYYYSHHNTVESRLRDTLCSVLRETSFRGLLLSSPSRLASDFAILNWLGFAVVLACIAVGLGCLVILAGIVSLQEAWARLGRAIVAWSMFLAGAVGCMLLFVHGSPVVTVAVLGLPLLAPLVFVAARLSSKQLYAAVGAILTAQGALVFAEKHLSSFVMRLTWTWHTALEALLCFPRDIEKHHGTPLSIGIAGLTFIVAGLLVGRNQTGPSVYWRERIQRAFLTISDDTRIATAAGWPLSALRPPAEDGAADAGEGDLAPRGCGALNGAPLPLITAAVNVPGSPNVLVRKRGTARFELSPYAIGGPLTGWAPTWRYGDGLTLADAIAVSAAAVNSQGGDSIPRWARSLLTALNLSLGVWFRNPRLAWNRELDARVAQANEDLRFRRLGHFWAGYAWNEIAATNAETDTLLLASDGGHHDNLGLTTLVNRGCRLIVVVDATADPEYCFSDLTHSAQLLAVAGDWQLKLDLDAARPRRPASKDPALRRVRRPIAVGQIKKQRQSITLIYVKAGVDDDVPFGVMRYAEAHQSFPHCPTADQFFDEAQFEAYYQLGEHLGALVAETDEWRVACLDQRADK
jgi:hypothetical protein